MLNENDSSIEEENTAIKILGDIFLRSRNKSEPISIEEFHSDIKTFQEAYAVQNYVAARLSPTLGVVKGWKVGASSSDTEPFAAPLHTATLFQGDTLLPKGMCQFFGVEAEIVYKMGKDLPSRDERWSSAEVLDAIESAHPAIEIFDTRFSHPNSQSFLVHLADQANHGALVYGNSYAAWRELNPMQEAVKVVINGQTAIEHKGGNSAGDPLRMLVWLAHHAQKRGLPLKAGDVITTGSMTGTIYVESGTKVRVEFGSLGTIGLQIP